MKKILPITMFYFICMTSMMAILPVIGPLIREMGLKEWHSGVIVGVSGILWMLLSRFWGKKSDDHGRRKILFITTIGYCISYIIFTYFIDTALHSTWSVTFIFFGLIIFRGFVGAFYAAFPTVSAARIADVTTSKDRSTGMAILGTGTGLGMVAGPTLAGFLSKESLMLPLYVAAFLPIIAVAIIFFALPKQKRNPQPAIAIKLSDPRLRLPIMAGFLASSCVYFANVCIGFYGLDVLGLSSKQAAHTSGIAMGCVGVCMIIAQIFIAKLKSITPIQWLVYGSLVGACGFLIISIFHTVQGLYIGYATTALGLGWVFPIVQTIASRSVSENEQGIASGSVAAAQGFAMVIAPIAGAALYQLSPFLPYLTSMTLLTCLFIIAIYHKLKS
ncbi:MAG: MFS transporter [Gammaproteobacteria bacterium]|nr:MFS transporter [Gammaproteobacteria bacterium]